MLCGLTKMRIWHRVSFYEYQAVTRLLPLHQVVDVTRKLQAVIRGGLVCIGMSHQMSRLFLLDVATGGVLVSFAGLWIVVLAACCHCPANGQPPGDGACIARGSLCAAHAFGGMRQGRARIWMSALAWETA